MPRAVGRLRPQEPENGSQPRVRDPKEHWEMHAVNLGVSAELAAARAQYKSKVASIRASRPRRYQKFV